MQCDEDEDRYEDQEGFEIEIESMSFLGRICVAEAFQYLGSMLTSITSDLFEASNQMILSGAHASSALQHRLNEAREEICWLIMLVSRLLTESDGESGEVCLCC
jgi:hypothetical protein